jgi:uncharacterized membrane protein required for colicin V production
MNWVDGVLLVLLLAAVIVGSKKGLVRELSAFIVFFTAIILTVNYIDNIAVWVYGRLGGSPLVSAFASFALLLGVSYGVFKLLGLLFYKIADLKHDKKRDQIGGAIVGFLRGYTAVGVLTFMTFLLPMPERFYADFDASFFGATIAKTVPLMYEGTAATHPNNPKFIPKIETTLIMESAKAPAGKSTMSEDREEVYRVMYQIDRFFSLSTTEKS